MKYNNNFRHIICGLALLSLASCEALHERREQREREEREEKARIVNQPLPPDYCSIHAKVVSIEQPVAGDTGIFARYPCRAKVQIVQVTGCRVTGMAVSAGAPATVKFAYTLEETRSIFPELSSEFPGLVPGDYFLAEIKKSVPGAAGELVVYSYKAEKTRSK